MVYIYHVSTVAGLNALTECILLYLIIYICGMFLHLSFTLINLVVELTGKVAAESGRIQWNFIRKKDDLCIKQKSTAAEDAIRAERDMNSNIYRIILLLGIRETKHSLILSLTVKITCLPSHGFCVSFAYTCMYYVCFLFTTLTNF